MHAQEARGEPCALTTASHGEEQLTLTRYWLVPHLYLCPTHDGVVLLDLRRDKYLGLGGAQMSALAAVVEGWPRHRDAKLNLEPTEIRNAVEIAELFVREGLLCRDSNSGKSALPVTVTEASTLIALGQEVEHRRAAQVIDLLKFLKSCTFAALALRLRHFEAVVQTVRARKERAGEAAIHFDAQKAAELADLFRRLRTYAYTAKGECLFHALALVNFLASYGVYPRWVIGVRTGPFAAHSWVQQAHFVLDATPEEVCPYTPILAV